MQMYAAWAVIAVPIKPTDGASPKFNKTYFTLRQLKNYWYTH